MENGGTSPCSSTKPLLAALAASVVLAPIFWFVGVLHFGIITAPEPTTGQMVSYILWTSAIGVLLLAPLLHLSVRAPCALGYARAAIVAIAALAPIQAATWIITLYQWGDDEMVAIGTLVTGFTAVHYLTRRLSKPIAENREPLGQTN
jgi:hypothetical protein